MPRYSDENLLEEIRRVADVVDADGGPTLQQFREHSEVTSTVFYRFGSWNAAVDAAGFEPRPPTEKIPREDLIDELQRLREEVGHIPTYKEMDEQGAYAYITYYERFGSWADALEEVFGEVPDREWVTVSDEKLRAELHRLAGDDGDPPTTTDVKERGAHALPTYKDRFGSWRAALIDAGFEPPPSQEVTTEELLADLRRLRDEFGERPTTTTAQEHGRYSVPTYYSRFGSWSDALAEAFEDVSDENS